MRVEVTLKVAGKTIALKKGVDYRLDYVNNRSKGKATVIVTGVGIANADGNAFVGSKTNKFSIIAGNLSDLLKK